MNAVLRPVEPDDLEVFFRHQADAEASRMARFPPRDREAFFRHWEERVLPDDRAGKWTIVWEGETAGYVVCFDREGKREVGYWLGREFWGRGIASAALAELLREETLRPLYARVVSTNAGSLRVLEKCGFREVAREPVTEDGESFEELLLELR